MSNKSYFIGVDGGGTKTKVVIEDQNGNLVGTGIGGASNIRLSVDNAWKSIYDAISQALYGTGIVLEDKNLDFHIGMGLAGVTIVDAKHRFLNTANLFKTLVLESDAHIACLGANDGGDGMIISVGTGVIGYMIKGKKSFRIGGWGFPHADTAGGAWIGMEAIRLTFSYADGCIPESEVLRNVYDHFDNDTFKMCQWACAANSTQFASIAPYVIKGIDKKDVYSEKLMTLAADEIDSMILSLRKKAGNEEISCSLLGGISPFLMPYLKSDNLKINHDKDAAAKGAMYFIRGSVDI